MKSNLAITDNGQIRDGNIVEFAEEVFKKKNQKDHWGAIDLLLKAWAERAPEEVDALEIQLTEYRETLVDKKFGQTKGGKDQERRFRLAFPRNLLMMIRTVYKPQELIMDQEFFNDFLKRYPFFKVAEK